MMPALLGRQRLDRRGAGRAATGRASRSCERTRAAHGPACASRCDAASSACETRPSGSHDEDGDRARRALARRAPPSVCDGSSPLQRRASSRTQSKALLVEGPERLRASGRQRRGCRHVLEAPRVSAARSRSCGRRAGARAPVRSRNACESSRRRSSSVVLRLDRLAQDAERPEADAAVGVLLGRDDVDRDVPRREVVLQPVEHPPAVDVGQLDVERDRVGPGVARERERRRRPASSTSALKPFSCAMSTGTGRSSRRSRR